MLEYENCKLCPRECGCDRISSHGFCRSGTIPRVAAAMLHMWEEPCISGTRGSGTIFFSSCTLKCSFCQNARISAGGFGAEQTPEQLAGVMLRLQSLGAHNINLVTPTHFYPSILRALDIAKPRLKIPVLANVGGYEKAETVRELRGYVDIFLTDIKYCSAELSGKLSAAGDYYKYALESTATMIETAGAPAFDGDGMMTNGVIIRHLVLPSHSADSIEIMRGVAERFDKSSYIMSLMRQFTPMDGCAELARRTTTFEYKRVIDECKRLGVNLVYVQEKESAETKYIPDFNLQNLIL